MYFDTFHDHFAPQVLPLDSDLDSSDFETAPSSPTIGAFHCASHSAVVNGTLDSPALLTESCVPEDLAILDEGTISGRRVSVASSSTNDTWPHAGSDDGWPSISDDNAWKMEKQDVDESVSEAAEIDPTDSEALLSNKSVSATFQDAGAQDAAPGTADEHMQELLNSLVNINSHPHSSSSTLVINSSNERNNLIRDAIDLLATASHVPEWVRPDHATYDYDMAFAWIRRKLESDWDIHNSATTQEIDLELPSAPVISSTEAVIPEIRTLSQAISYAGSPMELGADDPDLAPLLICYRLHLTLCSPPMSIIRDKCM